MRDNDILDERENRLELKVVTHTVLLQRFGPDVLVRELVMMDPNELRMMLKHFSGRPGALVRDLEDALAKHGWKIGTSWSELPPSKHPQVRNPAQMKAYRPTSRR